MPNVLADLKPWDFVLVVAVSLQATVLAYLYNPKWKAFVLTLPVPYTLAVLAVGRPVDATNVLGLILLLIFMHGVRLLHYDLRVPIVPSIVISSAVYCIIGSALARVVPADSVAFWTAAALTMGIAAIFYRSSSNSSEEGRRSACPVWIKLPIVMGVVLGLVIVKKSLHGFATTFPMVGFVATYEARKCLCTMTGQIPVLMMTIIPLMMVCRLAEHSLGLIASLALGWIVFFAVLYPFTGDL